MLNHSLTLALFSLSFPPTLSPFSLSKSDDIVMPIHENIKVLDILQSQSKNVTAFSQGVLLIDAHGGDGGNGGNGGTQPIVKS